MANNGKVLSRTFRIVSQQAIFFAKKGMVINMQKKRQILSFLLVLNLIFSSFLFVTNAREENMGLSGNESEIIEDEKDCINFKKTDYADNSATTFSSEDFFAGIDEYTADDSK